MKLLSRIEYVESADGPIFRYAVEITLTDLRTIIAEATPEEQQLFAEQVALLPPATPDAVVQEPIDFYQCAFCGTREHRNTRDLANHLETAHPEMLVTRKAKDT